MGCDIGGGAPQAVVNEKTDDEETHRRLMLEMAEQATKADELGRLMIAKESELGVLEHKLEVQAPKRVLCQCLCPCSGQPSSLQPTFALRANLGIRPAESGLSQTRCPPQSRSSAKSLTCT